MLEVAGVTANVRGQAIGGSELPDFAIAWRASESTGPAAAILDEVDAPQARAAVRAVLTPSCNQDIGYRLRSDFELVAGVVR